MVSEIKIERTGGAFSIAASEFRVTYPDGFVGTVWSPPWHDFDPDEEQAGALAFATKQWEAKTHKDKEDPAPTPEPRR